MKILFSYKNPTPYSHTTPYPLLDTYTHTHTNIDTHICTCMCVYIYISYHIHSYICNTCILAPFICIPAKNMKIHNTDMEDCVYPRPVHDCCRSWGKIMNIISLKKNGKFETLFSSQSLPPPFSRVVIKWSVKWCLSSISWSGEVEEELFPEKEERQWIKRQSVGRSKK